MTTDRKKELREKYESRHPVKGIVGLRSGDRAWVMITGDERADYNGTMFQLKLGSWPNKELQKAYSADPESFQWAMEEELEYEDEDDVKEDLALMLDEYLEKHPGTGLIRPMRKIR